jgi:alpha-D-xyloside xylohydrolase
MAGRTAFRHPALLALVLATGCQADDSGTAAATTGLEPSTTNTLETSTSATSSTGGGTNAGAVGVTSAGGAVTGTTATAASSTTTAVGGATSTTAAGGATSNSTAGDATGTGASGGTGAGGAGGELSCPTPPEGDSYAIDAEGITFTVESGQMRVEICKADILRVKYTTEASFPEKNSLSVNATWGTPSFCVSDDSGVVTITTARLKALVDKASGLVTYTDLSDQQILSEDSKSVTPVEVEGVDTYRIETVFDSPTDEALFGLGQHQDNVMNRKGSNRRILNVNTEINIPVLVSSRGYGVFWDNYSASDFYGGESDNTQYRYASEAGEMVDYYFFYGPSLDRVVALYRTATGAAPLFPKWAYGLFHSKDKYGSQSELLSVKNGYRDNQIPVDCIVQDWDYWTPYAWGSHFMDEDRYPDPAALIEEMHEDNVHTMISVWPVYQFKDQTQREGEMDNYDALEAIGALFASGGTHHFYDTLDPAARALVYQQTYDRLLEPYGWDGIWADNTEPQGYPDSVNVRAADTALGKGAFYLNAYPLGHAQGLYEGWRSLGPDSKRVYVLTRSAFAGQQRYATTCWSGDIDSDFETFARQVPAGLNFSLAGMPYWTTDIGGYWGHDVDWTTTENNELFTRWFQYGAFCPIFRIHGGGSRELFGDSWSSTTKANLLEIDQLRYRLMPYIYSLAWAVTSEGYSMMRHLVFDYPQDAEVYDIKDQFLFGPAFLVNPVTTQGATSRSIYFPAGDWYDFWTGEVTSGGTRVSVDAPLSEIPLFIRAGSIVPMGPSIQYASESIDPLEIRIYRGQDAEFTLYEDAGEGYEYESGQYSTIELLWSESAQQLTIGARQGTYPGMPTSRTFNIVWVSASHGSGIDAATADQAVEYDGTQVLVEAM